MTILKKASKNNYDREYLASASPYFGIKPGTIVYQNTKGEFLPDSQQPKPQNPQLYDPHQSTRYKNVIIGSNGKAQTAKFIRIENGFYTRILIDTEKDLPNLYESRSDCCGCSACYAICPVSEFLQNRGMGSIGLMAEKYDLPHGAIYMEEDEEGFQYPVVDASLCIRCFKCLEVCPIKMVLS